MSSETHPPESPTFQIRPKHELADDHSSRGSSRLASAFVWSWIGGRTAENNEERSIRNYIFIAVQLLSHRKPRQLANRVDVDSAPLSGPGQGQVRAPHKTQKQHWEELRVSVPLLLLHPCYCENKYC